MEKTLVRVKDLWGGFPQYAASIGVSSETIRALQENLLVSPRSLL